MTAKAAVQKLFLLLCLTLAWSALGAMETDASRHFSEGKSAYQAGDYEAAVGSFERAVEHRPEHAEYHRWLGRSYGRLAENSSWFRAIPLVKKTKHSLEKSVELDGTNVAALGDLLKFYEQAPAFFGGGTEKAERVRIRLTAVCASFDTPSEQCQELVTPAGSDADAVEDRKN